MVPNLFIAVDRSTFDIIIGARGVDVERSFQQVNLMEYTFDYVAMFCHGDWLASAKILLLQPSTNWSTDRHRSAVQKLGITALCDKRLNAMNVLALFAGKIHHKSALMRSTRPLNEHPQSTLNCSPASSLHARSLPTASQRRQWLVLIHTWILTGFTNSAGSKIESRNAINLRLEFAIGS